MFDYSISLLFFEHFMVLSQININIKKQYLNIYTIKTKKSRQIMYLWSYPFKN